MGRAESLIFEAYKCGCISLEEHNVELEALRADEKRERHNIYTMRRVLASNVYHNYNNIQSSSMEAIRSGINTANSFSAELQAKESAFREKYGHSA